MCTVVVEVVVVVMKKIKMDIVHYWTRSVINYCLCSTDIYSKHQLWKQIWQLNDFMLFEW